MKNGKRDAKDTLSSSAAIACNSLGVSMLSTDRPKRIETMLAQFNAGRSGVLLAVVIVNLTSSFSIAVVWAALMRFEVVPKLSVQNVDWVVIISGLLAPPLFNTLSVAFLASVIVAMILRNDRLGLSVFVTPCLLAALFSVPEGARAIATSVLFAACLFRLRNLERRNWLHGYFSAVLHQAYCNGRLICMALAGVWLAHVL